MRMGIGTMMRMEMIGTMMRREMIGEMMRMQMEDGEGPYCPVIPSSGLIRANFTPTMMTMMSLASGEIERRCYHCSRPESELPRYPNGKTKAGTHGTLLLIFS